MGARRSAAFGVNAPPYKVDTRLERVYTLTLYGGAPPRRLRCERGVCVSAAMMQQPTACFIMRAAHKKPGEDFIILSSVKLPLNNQSTTIIHFINIIVQ